MPAGTYLLTDHDGPSAEERFTCDADGDGWTYAATRHDPVTGALTGRLHLQLDGAGATIRLHAEAGGWVLRGGCVGEQALWRRGEQEHEQTAAGFSGTSPSYAVAAARRADLEVGESRRLVLVAVTEPVLATRVVEQAWTRTAADRWEAADLSTGERRAFRLQGGLVLEGSGLTLTQR